jgi:putative ABC transport system permease protein
VLDDEGTVLLDVLVAERLNADVGDTITVGRAEPRRLRVGGVVRSVTGDKVVMSYATARPMFGELVPTHVLVRARSDTELASIRRDLEQRFAAEELTIWTSLEGEQASRREVARTLDAETTLLVALTGLTFLGVLNVFAANVADRKERLALQTLLGSTRRQHVRTIVLEASSLTAAATLLAVPLGLLLSRSYVRGVQVPLGWIALVAAGALLAAVVVSVVPARTASRTNVKEIIVLPA